MNEQDKRHALIGLVLRKACSHADVLAEQVDLDEWMSPNGLKTHERARGWADLADRGVGVRTFRFCPDVIAASTEHLDLIEPLTHEPEPDEYGSLNYFTHLIGTLIVQQNRLWGTVDPVGAALDAVADNMDGAAIHLLFRVQNSMLDEAVGVRPDLVGSQDWADQQDINLLITTEEVN